MQVLMTVRSQLADQPGGIFFLGDRPNDEAEIKGYPFVGSDGHLLARALRAAGLTDPSVPESDFARAPLAETRRLLWERRAHSFALMTSWPVAEILSCRPNLVVTLGDRALEWLTGHSSTDEWRGAVRRVSENAPIMKVTASEAERAWLRGLKIFPTIPLERVLQQYKLLGVLIADLMKVKYEAAFPELRPLQIAVWLEPELDDLARFAREHVQGSDLITLDIETAVGQIVCVQIGTSPTCALVLPFVDYRKPSRSYWETEADELAAWQWLAQVLDTPQPKLMQNGAAYDVFWLLDRAGLPVRNYRHDLRLVHHILQPEWPKSLAFMGMYTNLPRWKADVKHGHGGTEDKRDS
jgi:uracil-DNA glycosylase